MSVRATALALLLAVAGPAHERALPAGQVASSDEAPPPEAFRVLDATADSDPRRAPYLLYQLERAARQESARRARFAAVRSREDLRRLKAEIHGKVLRMIGGLPKARTPLHARVTSSIPLAGYRIETLIFESLPGLHVTALVYVPDGPVVPRPAVLLACGHSPLGKAHPPYQQIAGRLARRGYVVLCWDPIGQGERSQFWDAQRRRSRYNLVCGEHAVLGNLACLAGASLLRWEIWDGMRALDYLLTRPEVDGGRISITGTSGGGLQSAWIGALDERIGVIAPSCYVTALPRRMANRIFEDPDTDPEQDPYELVSAGVDHAGLLLLVHPRPLFIAAAVRDFVPIEGTRQTFAELAEFYRRFGDRDRLGMVEGDHPHRFSPENQQAAFAFLDRFNGRAPGAGLDALRTLEPEALRCTRTGQVRVDLPGRSLMELIREFARGARTAVSLRERYRAAGYAGVSGWTVGQAADRRGPRTIGWEKAGSWHGAGVAIDRYRLYHSGGLVMPLLHVHRTAAGARALLDLGYSGKASAKEWTELQRALDEGWDVLSFDLRGLGETRMPYRAASVDDPDLAPVDEARAYVSPLSGVLANYAYNALLTGRPYFLELIEDVEIAARFAREGLGISRLAVAGRGEAQTLAVASSAALPGLELREGSGEGLGIWRRRVEQLVEDWPIHELLPAAAFSGR